MAKHRKDVPSTMVTTLSSLVTPLSMRVLRGLATFLLTLLSIFALAAISAFTVFSIAGGGFPTVIVMITGIALLALMTVVGVRFKLF